MQYIVAASCCIGFMLVTCPCVCLCAAAPPVHFNRILWSFKLNPYERLNLRFTATPEEIRKQYRKISLMVHPDKCKHPQAAEAFDSKQAECGTGPAGVASTSHLGRWNLGTQLDDRSSNGPLV